MKGKLVTDMLRIWATGVAMTIVAFAYLLVGIQPAMATPEPAQTLGDCNVGWYVNLDEVDRKPTPGPAGLKFEGNDLIHYAKTLPVADLKPGVYSADPTPDQASFFSVEVRSGSNAYGTLRWNPTTSKWSITIGPGGAATDGTFENADPVALLAGKVTKWGAFDPETNQVVSFGVGYTNSPPGKVATVVTEVVFAGKTYDMKCKGPESPSPSPDASSSSPAAAATSVAQPTLPVTGFNAGAVAVIGSALLGLGIGLVLIARRRRG